MPHAKRRWSPSVTVAAVIEEGGRFLLVEERTPEGLRLNQPAGHLEPGETPEQGAVREVLEETARAFELEALLGVYLSRFVRPASGEDVTYLRLAYRGRVGAPLEGRALDHGIVRTLWLTPDEIRAESARHRSPLVMRCIDDYLSGRAHPLAAVAADGSLAQPVVLRRDAPPRRGGPHGGQGGEMPPPIPASPLPDATLADATLADATLPASELPDSASVAAHPPCAPLPAPACPGSQGAAGGAAPPAPEPTPAQTAAALAERFPALFAAGAAKPVKLRIHADIQQRAPGVFTRRQLAVFLHRHTTSTAYLRALAASTQRFDLDGLPAGEVAAEHRDAAAAEVERRRQIALERRAAERAARGGAHHAPHRAPPPARSGRVSGPADGAAAGQATSSGAVTPPQPHGPARPHRAHPQAVQARGAPRSPERPERANRADRAELHARPPRAPRPDHERRRHAPPGSAMQEQAAPPLPDDPARRERALLLRAWEGSPLTQANFCALKGLDPAQFGAQIELAQRERAERQAARQG